MTDQERRELSERLAKWAGFALGEKDFQFNKSGLPNFTRSLDAQAEYLWPKLGTIGFSFEQEITVSGELLGWSAYCQRGEEWWEEFSEDSPAEAIALAIDAAIGEKP